MAETGRGRRVAGCCAVPQGKQSALSQLPSVKGGRLAPPAFLLYLARLLSPQANPSINAADQCTITDQLLPDGSGIYSQRFSLIMPSKPAVNHSPSTLKAGARRFSTAPMMDKQCGVIMSLFLKDFYLLSVSNSDFIRTDTRCATGKKCLPAATSSNSPRPSALAKYWRLLPRTAFPA